MTPDHPEWAALHEQLRYLRRALDQNTVMQAVLAAAAELSLPHWYLGAGSVCQTVWNLRHGFDAIAGIKDYDLVYFDPVDLSAETENNVADNLARLLADPSVVIDVKNQGRVHLWYTERFGTPIHPYLSSEAAIATWPTTASSVGVRRDDNGLAVYAPFGLSDLIGMVVRPNKTLVSEEVYTRKASAWATRWPRVRVVPW